MIRWFSVAGRAMASAPLPVARLTTGFEQLVGVPKYFIERRMREMKIDQPVVYADHLIGIIEFETEPKRVLKSRADFLAA